MKGNERLMQASWRGYCAGASGTAREHYSTMGIHHGPEADFPCQAIAIMPSYRIAGQKLSSCGEKKTKKHGEGLS